MKLGRGEQESCELSAESRVLAMEEEIGWTAREADRRNSDMYMRGTLAVLYTKRWRNCSHSPR